MKNSYLQDLLRSALETEDFEISCQDCYELLDTYAELLISEENPDQILPNVKQHLKHCICCGHELEALMVMLKEFTSTAES